MVRQPEQGSSDSVTVSTAMWRKPLTSDTADRWLPVAYLPEAFLLPFKGHHIGSASGGHKRGGEAREGRDVNRAAEESETTQQA